MKVNIIYFKPNGKYYCIDEDVEWAADPHHYTGYIPFTDLHRIKEMHAVCMENPLGFPQMSLPKIIRR